MYNMQLWETSGHAANYKENMFLIEVRFVFLLFDKNKSSSLSLLGIIRKREAKTSGAKRKKKRLIRKEFCNLRVFFQMGLVKRNFGHPPLPPKHTHAICQVVWAPTLVLLINIMPTKSCLNYVSFWKVGICDS